MIMDDLFDDQNPLQKVERRALEIWQLREMNYPARIRRMNPDNLDRGSGAWDRVLIQATTELGMLPCLISQRP